MTDLAGRTFLVTGSNSGIGCATAADLARRGGRVHIACRSPGRGEAAVAASAAQAGSGQVSDLHLDLADLGSVRHTAREFLALGEPLHVLINNAGVGCDNFLDGLFRGRASGTPSAGKARANNRELETRSDRVECVRECECDHLVLSGE
jgi:NAD(P)-dependent dehydrogenase (short-subunit alcohol dehydrogenase family)